MTNASMSGSARVTRKEGGRLAGKVAVITGGGSGFGANASRRFVEEGANVVIADWDSDTGGAVADELGENALFVRCDHTSRDDDARVVAAALERWGRLDVLYCNAGIGWTGGPDDVTDAVMSRIIDVDLLGPWRMALTALPALRKSAAERPGIGSSLVFTASGLGLYAWPGVSAYTVAKHGVVGLMRSLSLDLGPDGIRVNAICPGISDTPAVRRDQTNWGEIDSVLEHWRTQTPLGRLIDTSDIADAAVYFASDESKTVSGSAFVIDGGQHGW